MVRVSPLGEGRVAAVCSNCVGYDCMVHELVGRGLNLHPTHCAQGTDTCSYSTRTVGCEDLCLSTRGVHGRGLTMHPARGGMFQVV